MSSSSQFQLFILIVTIPLLAVFVSWMSFKQDGKTIQSLELQLAFIKAYVFPENYLDQIKLRYPHLSIEYIHTAFEQLRLYFTVHRTHAPQVLPMPSKIVDDCWHIFICDTRRYQMFCEGAFGNYLHHEAHVQVELETEVENAQDQATKDALAHLLAGARIFQWAAAIEQATTTDKTMVSDASSAVALKRTEVPALFTIDADFQIKDGFIYPSEYLLKLAIFDIKAAEASASLDSPSSGSIALGCGDGGAAICGSCGGSI